MVRVVLQLYLSKLYIPQPIFFSMYVQRRKRMRRATQLQYGLVHVVFVQVCVADGYADPADAQICLMGNQMRQ